MINAMLGTRKLARTSSTPGRTQSVNFYRVNESFRFVDLPGYGYAKVPESVRKTWGPMIEGALERRRERIVLAVHVVDARHEPTRLDQVMQEWLEAKKIPSVVAATKADKLSGNARARVSRDLAEIPDDVTAKLDIRLVENMDDVLEVALMERVPHLALGGRVEDKKDLGDRGGDPVTH